MYEDNLEKKSEQAGITKTAGGVEGGVEEESSEDDLEEDRSDVG